MPFIGEDGLVNGLVCLNIHSNDDSYSNDDSDDDFDSNDDSKYVPVPLTKVHVEARVVNFVSQVTVTQNYINKEKNPIEAIYFFPVEEEAAVIDFTAELEGRTVKTVVKEKVEAKQEYQEAVRDRKTAFLLEETKQDIFQIHVGHLSPGSGCTISITYLSELPVEDGKTRLTVPTTIAPRYVPADDKSEASGKIASIEYDYKTPANLTFKLETIMKTKIKGIESPSHTVVSKIESEADNNNFFVGETQFEGSISDMDRDIVVLIETEEPNQPKIILEKNEEGATVGMLSLVPSFELKDITAEIIFLVDCSGSMSGQSINLAKEALHLFLHSLPMDCYFNIVCFGSSFESLFSESKKYDDITLDTAKNLAANLSANLGGTKILLPLEHIFNQTSIPGNPRQVFVLTDGAVSNSSQCINCVKKNNDTSRVFTLGIGSSADRHLVKGMARAGQGTAIFATYGEKIAPKVLKQLKNSLQPCINKVKINWGDGVQQGNIKWQKPVIETTKTLMGYGKPKAGAVGLSEEKSAINNQAPNIVPAIYDGSRLLIYKQFMDGKYPDHVTVTANTPDGALDLVLPIDKNNILEGNLVHQMFARKLIQDLEEGGDDLDQFYEGRTDFIKSKIVELGIKYKLASKYTSFVGVDEKQGKESKVMMTRQIKNQVAHGYGGWGGNLQPPTGGIRRAGGNLGGIMCGGYGGNLGEIRKAGRNLGGIGGWGGKDGGMQTYGYGGSGGNLGRYGGCGGNLGGMQTYGFGGSGGNLGGIGGCGGNLGGMQTYGFGGSGGHQGGIRGSGGNLGGIGGCGGNLGGMQTYGFGGSGVSPSGPGVSRAEFGSAPLSLLNDVAQSNEDYDVFGEHKRPTIASRESDYQKARRNNMQISPARVDFFADGGKTPEVGARGYAQIMKEQANKTTEVDYRKQMEEKAKDGTLKAMEETNGAAKRHLGGIGGSGGNLGGIGGCGGNLGGMQTYEYGGSGMNLVKFRGSGGNLGGIGESGGNLGGIGGHRGTRKRKRSATHLSYDEKLIQLTSLQIANGSFKWGDIIEKVSNKSLVDIEAAAAMSGVENDVWLTAVVVMVIETQFDDDKESWEMIVEKAKKWLNKIGNSWDCLFSKVKEFVI